MLLFHSVLYNIYSPLATYFVRLYLDEHYLATNTFISIPKTVEKRHKLQNQQCQLVTCDNLLCKYIDSF